MRALHGVAALAAVAALTCAQRPATAQDPKPFSEERAYLSEEGFQRWISSGSPHAAAWLQAHGQQAPGANAQPQYAQAGAPSPRRAQQVRIAPAHRATVPGAVHAPPHAKSGPPTRPPSEARLQVVAERPPSPYGRAVDELIRRVDAVHADAVHGELTDVTAMVEVPSVTGQLAAQNYDAKIQFAWKAPDQCRFDLSGLPRKGEALRSELLCLLQRQGRYLLPPSLAQFAEGYSLSVVTEGGLYRLNGSAQDPDDEIQQFSLWIHPNGRMAKRFYQTSSTRELHTSLSYRAVEGGLLVSSFYVTTVPMPEPPEPQEGEEAQPVAVEPPPFSRTNSVVRRVGIEYEQTEGIWMPVTLTSAPVRGDSAPFSLLLKGYQADTGVQEAFFKGTGCATGWR